MDSQVRIELTIIVLQTIPLTIWVLGVMARRLGLEHRLSVLETDVLPLNYQRMVWNVGLEPTSPVWKTSSLTN